MEKEYHFMKGNTSDPWTRWANSGEGEGEREGVKRERGGEDLFIII